MKKIFILDLDGTLYYQFPVRMMMVVELCFYYLFHLSNLKELRILLAYRKAHENIVFDLNQFAKKYSCSPEKIQKIVQYWMQERPLKWISFFADKKLISLLRNERTFVFSDYPTQRKLKALNFMPEGQFFYGDGNIRFMKPHPQGLSIIESKYHLDKKDMIFIGDRFEKDGLCAQNFGCTCILLNSFPFFRYFQYKRIKNAIKS